MAKFQVNKQFQPARALLKLKRIRREIDGTILQIENSFKTYKKGRIRCKKCGVMNIRVRKDKSYFCRSCGYDSKKKK